ncbi:MAG: diaminopimelate epimerase [Acidimicrobiia bacterium]|nr:MAG: diaminopimelate epimerase [Acidimicrobiia bacterium]
MSPLALSKLHATGNDFLVTLALDPDSPPLDAVEVAALCDRHRGVGADGLITVTPGRGGSDCTMTLVNADGGLAEMSGNGIRCLAWVAARAGLARGDTLVVDTAAGRRVVALERAGGEVVAAEVDMGPVTFDPARIPVEADSPFGLEAVVEDVAYLGDAAGMGNPHLVVFVDDPADVPVARHGPRLERDRRFPRRANVEFVAVAAPDRVTMRVWERGVGETLSCGTGACAAAAVAHRRGLVPERVRVDVPGGTLTVTLGPSVRLGGPVVHVFDVDIPRERLRRSLARPA